MEILHVYADSQITCVQGAGVFNLFEESWISKTRIPPKETELTRNTDLTDLQSH
jgi:hypothetical protein